MKWRTYVPIVESNSHSLNENIIAETVGMSSAESKRFSFTVSLNLYIFFFYSNLQGNNYEND